MSDELRAAQAELVASLLENRVPKGFDEKGIHATAAVLRHKRRQTAERQPQRVRFRDSFVRVMGRVYAWWTAVG
jgi:hypothetical protein